MTGMDRPGTLVLVMAAAVLAPLLALGVARRLPVPLVVFQILLGVLLGPDVLVSRITDEGESLPSAADEAERIPVGAR